MSSPAAHLRVSFCSRHSLIFLVCLFSSQNGSPVDTADQGALIATVTKKRKGNEGANFEINVGDGKYISLNDPDGVEGLDESMKATAASQLKVLRDQMENLMAQLAN
jgi:hypothetical protein